MIATGRPGTRTWKDFKLAQLERRRPRAIGRPGGDSNTRLEAQAGGLSQAQAARRRQPGTGRAQAWPRSVDSQGRAGRHWQPSLQKLGS
jgi:hypothetical protein